MPDSKMRLNVLYHSGDALQMITQRSPGLFNEPILPSAHVRLNRLHGLYISWRELELPAADEKRGVTPVSGRNMPL